MRRATTQPLYCRAKHQHQQQQPHQGAVASASHLADQTEHLPAVAAAAPTRGDSVIPAARLGTRRPGMRVPLQQQQQQGLDQSASRAVCWTRPASTCCPRLLCRPPPCCLRIGWGRSRQPSFGRIPRGHTGGEVRGSGWITDCMMDLSRSSPSAEKVCTNSLCPQLMIQAKRRNGGDIWPWKQVFLPPTASNRPVFALERRNPAPTYRQLQLCQSERRKQPPRCLIASLDIN